ncbi:MAG: IS1 family transposase, partial [Microcystis sp.]
MRECPECQSNHINKNGHKKGKQNYICVNCG